MQRNMYSFNQPVITNKGTAGWFDFKNKTNKYEIFSYNVEYAFQLEKHK